MKKIILLFCLVWIFGVLINPTFGQGIDVDLQLFIPAQGIFYLNDLSVGDLSSAPIVFTVQLTNNYPEEKMVKLTLIITQITQMSNSLELLRSETNFFPLLPGILPLTSRDILSESGEYALTDVTIENTSDQLKDYILSTGKLPTGRYEFQIQVEVQGDTNPAGTDIEEININTPTLLDLVSPGQRADSPHLPELFTKQPFFQWESNATKFEVTVCEKLGTNTSPEDVMHNEPRVREIVENQTFYQYPPDAWELEDGKTYYWQIVALIESSGGEMRLESEIWGFTIANMSSGVFSVQHEQVVNYLRTMLGDDVVENLFKEGGELDGFVFTGVALENGAQISLEDINNLIIKFMGGEIKINEYTVE